MKHLEMTNLSEREKELIKAFLREAYIDGGRPLQFVAKKFIMANYWYHNYCPFAFGIEYTVYRILSKIMNIKKSIINRENLKQLLIEEIYCIYPWEQIDDNDPLWTLTIYRGVGARTIFNTDPHSMKTFMADLTHMMKREREFSKSIERCRFGGTPDMPF